MGFYEDHLRTVAVRQGDKLKAGTSANEIRKYLAGIGWNDSEIDTMLRIAERAAHNV